MIIFIIIVDSFGRTIVRERDEDSRRENSNDNDGNKYSYYM